MANQIQASSYLSTIERKMNELLTRVHSVNTDLPENPSLVEIAQSIIQNNYPAQHQWNDCTLIETIAKVNGDDEVSKKISSLILPVAPNLLSSLLPELLNLVSLHLKPKALVNCRTTCRALQNAVKAEWIFRQAVIFNSGERYVSSFLELKLANADWLRIYRREPNLTDKIKLLTLFFHHSTSKQQELLPSILSDLPQFFLANCPVRKLTLNRKTLDGNWHRMSEIMGSQVKPLQIKKLELNLEDLIGIGCFFDSEVSFLKSISIINNFLAFNNIEKLKINNFFSFYHNLYTAGQNNNSNKAIEYNFKKIESNLCCPVSQTRWLSEKTNAFPSVTHVIIKTFECDIEGNFEFLGKAFPNVEEIKIRGVHFEVNLAFFNYLPNLKVLNINSKIEFSHLQKFCELILQKNSFVKIQFLGVVKLESNPAGNTVKSDVKYEKIFNFVNNHYSQRSLSQTSSGCFISFKEKVI